MPTGSRGRLIKALAQHLGEGLLFLLTWARPPVEDDNNYSKFPGRGRHVLHAFNREIEAYRKHVWYNDSPLPWLLSEVTQVVVWRAMLALSGNATGFRPADRRCLAKIIPKGQ